MEKLEAVLKQVVLAKHLRLWFKSIQVVHELNPLLSLGQFPRVLDDDEQNFEESSLELYWQSQNAVVRDKLLLERAYFHSLARVVRPLWVVTTMDEL